MYSHLIEPTRAFGQPPVSGVIRQSLDDFVVDEVLGFELDGEGEHVCLHMRKRGMNTEEVARRIAKLAGVRQMDVSYAGLKDRYAVTTQWFSIYLSNKPEPDWHSLESEELTIVEVSRHGRKLRRGTLKANRFTLVVRQLQGDTVLLSERLEKVKTQGVPNYFGEQRFGRANLDRASDLFAKRIKVRDRHKKGMYFSAARSALFNAVLAYRVELATWNQAMVGEVMMLDGSHSVFNADEVDDTLIQRLREFDIHPTGPLWGRGRLATADEVLELEEQVLEPYFDWREGLENAGLKQERRALRLLPANMTWVLAEDALRLSFELPSGTYATSVLREITELTVS